MLTFVDPSRTPLAPNNLGNMIKKLVPSRGAGVGVGWGGGVGVGRNFEAVLRDTSAKWPLETHTPLTLFSKSVTRTLVGFFFRLRGP